MHLKNYMEDVVWERLNDVLARYDNICTCEKCRCDIAALALNFLPNRYVVTKKGETYTRIDTLEQQFNVDVTTAIMRAIKIVKEQPRHQ